MSKYFRRRLYLSSLRGVAFASLLGATLVGFVGCAGGSNPFCCNSKEKNQVEANLERAQSLDENLETPTPVEETEKEPKPETTISAGIFPTDGSGDATTASAPAQTSTPQTFADANAPTQEMPVTSSTRDVAPNALVEAPVIAAPTLKLNEAETTGDVPNAPVDDANDAQTAPETSNENANAEDAQNPQNAANLETSTPETPAANANDAQTAPETSNENANAEDAQNPQNAANPETPAVNASARRPASPLRRGGGPQRAATRQIAQRGSPQTVAVPQTRGVATLSVPAVEPASGATVVKIRTRMFVP